MVVAVVEADEYGDDTAYTLVGPMAHFRLSICEQMEAFGKMIHGMSRLATYELSGEHLHTGVQNNFLFMVLVGQDSAVTDFYIDQLEGMLIVSINI